MMIRTNRLCKGAFLTLLLIAVACMVPTRGEAQSLMLTGYADFEAMLNNPAGEGDSQFYFDNHHFNLVGMGQIYGGLFAAAEVEYEHAGEEIALEYGYIGYTGIKNLRIMAGKFIVPFGRFNKDLHPSWINKMVDRPHGFKNILPQTYSDVGIWVSGVGPLSNGTSFVYDAFVLNGLLGSDGGDIRGMRDNDREKREGERDKNKALGGRIGLELAPQGFDIGGSVYYGNYSDVADTDLKLFMVGADAAFRKAGFEIRGEVIHANQEATEGDLKKTGGYVQAAYLVRPQIEPVVRFSARNMPGDNQDQKRLSFGINVYVAASSAVRLNYHVNIEKSDFEKDNDVVALQFNVSF